MRTSAICVVEVLGVHEKTHDLETVVVQAKERTQSYIVDATW
jgi:hypothetical protein